MSEPFCMDQGNRKENKSAQYRPWVEMKRRGSCMPRELELELFTIINFLCAWQEGIYKGKQTSSKFEKHKHLITQGQLQTKRLQLSLPPASSSITLSLLPAFHKQNEDINAITHRGFCPLSSGLGKLHHRLP